MKAAALALPALLAACNFGGDCLPAALSPEREAFRQQLRGLVHVSQCPGLPTPKALGERSGALFSREQALLAQIRASKLAPDLEQAIREDQEWSRNVNEADCAIYSPEYAETPEGTKDYEAGLRADEARLRTLETHFQRLNAPCIGG